MDLCKKTVMYHGKWTSLISADWKHGNHTGVWEYIERNTAHRGIVIIPLYGKTNEVLLIRQKRIPLNAFVIEFPAGLTDEGESTESCALRELREETGAVGVITAVSPPLTTSPGLTSECVTFVTVDVVDIGAPSPEQSEDIERLRVPLDSLQSFLEQRQNDSIIDAKVWIYALSLA